MGRKKKPFIDKKKAQRFQLVPRSQRDPLLGDAEETQYVLKPTEATPLSREEQLEEQHKYGIHFSDDYDYLQHLKEPGTCSVMEPVIQEQDRSEQLPQELFGSDLVVEGQLQKVLPVTGPQPDWDPDIVAALERAELTSDPEEQLEDDFVFMANGGEPGVPVYVSEQHLEDDHNTAPWWQERVDFLDGAAKQSDKSDQSDSDMEEEGEEEDENEEEVHRKDVFRLNSDCERKSARFTEYSLSSSVVPRNDVLTLLDDRFEQFMGEYDDSQIGPLDDEGEIPSTVAPDQWLLEYAIQDFNKHHKDKLKQLDEEIAAEEKADTLEADVDSSGESEGSGDSGSGGDMEVVQVEERGRGLGRKEQWDCESILSTYSNLYNHPTRIAEPGTEGKRIKLSQKTGIPLGAVPGPLPKERHPKQAPTRRQPGESKDEKRTRKQAVKEERRQRRAEKKATKLAFKSEQLKQGLACQHHTAAVV